MNAKSLLRSPTFWRKAVLITGGAALLAFAFLKTGGFFGEKIEPGAASTPPGIPPTPPPPDRITRAEQVDEPVVERFPGSVAAVRDAAVGARIIARVEQVLVRPGEHVTAGQELAVLDRRDLESRYLQVQEEIAGAEARLEEARTQNERMANVAPGAVSRAQVDSARAAFESAQSEFQRTTQQLEEARVAVTYATVEAPFDAIVIERFAEPGDLASPGKPIVELYDPSAMRLESWVRESVAISLEPGSTVRVWLDSPGEEVEGTVEEIVPQAEAGSRSFLVKVALPARANLYPGMFGRLLLPVGTTARVLVPQEAVTQVGQLTFVTLADSPATRRLVVPGPDRPDGKREILSGLTAGEAIVLP